MSKEKQIEEMAKEVCHMMCQSHVFCEAQEPCGVALMMAVNICEGGYRKQSEGEWTKHLDEWDCEYAKCSCCGEEFYDSSGEDTIDMFYKFCPNCGAKMKG